MLKNQLQWSYSSYHQNDGNEYVPKKVIDRINHKLLGGFREEVQRSSLPVLGFSECPLQELTELSAQAFVSMEEEHVLEAIMASDSVPKGFERGKCMAGAPGQTRAPFFGSLTIGVWRFHHLPVGPDVVRAQWTMRGRPKVVGEVRRVLQGTRRSTQQSRHAQPLRKHHHPENKTRHSTHIHRWVRLLKYARNESLDMLRTSIIPGNDHF